MKGQLCTVCGKPSIPGLVPEQGKCQYHWNAGVWGKSWADKVQRPRFRGEVYCHYAQEWIPMGRHRSNCPRCGALVAQGGSHPVRPVETKGGDQ